MSEVSTMTIRSFKNMAFLLLRKVKRQLLVIPFIVILAMIGLIWLSKGMHQNGVWQHSPIHHVLPTPNIAQRLTQKVSSVPKQRGVLQTSTQKAFSVPKQRGVLRTSPEMVYHKPILQKLRLVPTQHRNIPQPKLTMRHSRVSNRTRIKVALTATITTRGATFQKDNIENTLLLYSELTRTLCDTGSPQFDYGIYAAYDNDDPWLTMPEFFHDLKDIFRELVKRICEPKGIFVVVKFFQMNYRKLISPAMNDASMEAYYDGYDYFYRVNDDTLLKTKKWTEAFIGFLQRQHPENVGATCPDLIGDDQKIWQYDFVHRRHIEIHGVYYPRIFVEWYQTEWITYLYEQRGKPLSHIKILHTKSKGTRYSIADIKDYTMIGKKKLFEIIGYGKYLVHKYVEVASATPIGSDKIISFSTDGSTFHKIFGLVRNAQLAKIFFPKWRVRVYLEPRPTNTSKPIYDIVPERFQRVLEGLNVQIVYPDRKFIKSIGPTYWKNLVADDKTVKRFIVRDVEGRLSERDSYLVRVWELSGLPFHVIYDGITFGKVIPDGMWGGTLGGMNKLGHSIVTSLSFGGTNITILSSAMFQNIQMYTLAHVNTTECPFTKCQPILQRKDQFDFYLSQKFADNEVLK